MRIGLLQALGISEDRAGPWMDGRFELDLLFDGYWSQAVERRLEDGNELDWLPIYRDPTRHDSGYVEQVAHHLCQEPDVALRRIECTVDKDWIVSLGLQDVEPPCHSIERGAQLVRDHRQELILGQVRPLGLVSGLPLEFRQPRALFLEAPALTDVSGDR